MPSSDLSRRALLAGVTAVTTGLAGCSALSLGSDAESIPDATPDGDDWPMAGYDARNSRYNADASPPRDTPETRWAVEFAGCYRPLVRGDRVVCNAVIETDRIATVGLDAEDGNRLWRSDSQPWGIEPPAVGSERAYVTGTDCVYGVDLDTGAETWYGQPCWGANTASGTLADGRLYLEHGGFFSALDAGGTPRWASQHDARGSPAVGGDRAYISTTLTVEAVDLTAPTREWPWEDRDDDEPPHAERERATDWSEPPDDSLVGPRFYHSPAVADGTVFVTADYRNRPGGELRALSRADGEERWRRSAPPRPAPGEESRSAPEPVGRPVAPVVTDDAVVTCLGDRQVHALDHAGTVRWTTTLSHDVRELVGAGETLLAAIHDRSVGRAGPGHAGIVALDRATGERLWSVSVPDHVDGLTVAGETVYARVVSDRQADGEPVPDRVIALA